MAGLLWAILAGLYYVPHAALHCTTQYYVHYPAVLLQYYMSYVLRSTTLYCAVLCCTTQLRMMFRYMYFSASFDWTDVRTLLFLSSILMCNTSWAYLLSPLPRYRSVMWGRYLPVKFHAPSSVLKEPHSYCYFFSLEGGPAESRTRLAEWRVKESKLWDRCLPAKLD